MRGRIFAVPLLIIGLFVATPAMAFFDVIDKLKNQLGLEPEVAPDPTAELKELLKELEGSTVPTFSDIPADAWFARYVAAVAKWKIVDGYRDTAGNRTGTFGPNDPITVAQMLKMALRGAKIDEEKCRGTPVHPEAVGHWAEKFILCAENRKFRILHNGPAPDLERNATRAEALVVIHDAFRELIPPLPSPFEDSHGHPYEPDIAYAHIHGVVSGDVDEKGELLWRFRPNADISRAEVAKILYEHLRSVILNEENADSIVIDVATKNHEFLPKTITVRQGQFVTLRFSNAGRHTFTVPDLEINKLLANPVENITFIADTSGEFPFFCAVEGHQALGMVGTIIVK